MSYWRMSFRVGKGGFEMWPLCYAARVAAITYFPHAEADLSQLSPSDRRALMSPLAAAQKYALGTVVEQMAIGDTIYVKQGPDIVGRGIVSGPYRFDPSTPVVEPSGTPWAHQVPVDWEPSFVPIRMQLGDTQQFTVRELESDDLRRIEERESVAAAEVAERSAIEGREYMQQVTFRERNQSLIAAKKANSDCKCEICEFSFVETYGEIGQGYIIAHHIEALGHREAPSRTTLDDIALVCANCHAMLHVQDPPLLPAELRAILKRRK